MLMQTYTYIAKLQREAELYAMRARIAYEDGRYNIAKRWQLHASNTYEDARLYYALLQR